MKWPETVDKPQFGMADFQWTDCPISLDNMTVFASGIHIFAGYLPYFIKYWVNKAKT